MWIGNWMSPLNFYIKLAFPAESQLRRPVGAGNARTPARADFVDDANTPSNEMADLVSLNMAVPVRIISDMRDNPKTLNRSGVYIYNIKRELFFKSN